MAGLDSTTALLTCNPEYYSAWNYRRDILLQMFKEAETSEGAQTLQTRLLEGDLMLLQQNMRMYPKVYWLWNHRRWCLQMLPVVSSNPSKKWENELSLVDMMLEMDSRNCTYTRILLESWVGIIDDGSWKSLLLRFLLNGMTIKHVSPHLFRYPLCLTVCERLIWNLQKVNSGILFAKSKATLVTLVRGTNDPNY